MHQQNMNIAVHFENEGLTAHSLNEQNNYVSNLSPKEMNLFLLGFEIGWKNLLDTLEKRDG
jgi:hypothetical protein